MPCQQDLGGALDSLLRDVFDLPEPASVEDLTEQEQYREFMGTSGIHSIIDVLTVITADFAGCESVFI